MHCPNCGTRNEDDSLFCLQCGMSLPTTAQPSAPLSAPQAVLPPQHWKLITSVAVAMVAMAALVFAASRRPPPPVVVVVTSKPAPTPAPYPTYTPYPTPLTQIVLVTKVVPVTQIEPVTQPAATSLFTVYASRGWNNTGLNIGIGDLVQIEYQSGLWTYWPGKIAPFDANGNPGRYICAELIEASSCVEPLPEANKGSLIARIGATKPIHVGNQRAFRAANAGLLELSMNDSKLASDFSKDEGSVVVRTTIIRSP